MKFINKKKIKEKKNKKSFFKIINRYSIIILIFFLGIWAERFDIKLKIKNFTNEITETLASRIYSSFGKGADKLVFDIKYRDYMEILSSREKSIKAFRASEEIHEWVPAGTQQYFSRTLDPERLKNHRWEFVGRKAGEDVRKKYVGRVLDFERSFGNSFVKMGYD